MVKGDGVVFPRGEFVVVEGLGAVVMVVGGVGEGGGWETRE